MSTESAMVHLDNFKCLDNNFLVFTMRLLHVSCSKEDKIIRAPMDMLFNELKQMYQMEAVETDLYLMNGSM